MCTLAIYHRVSDRFPVVIAANRDEVLARPATAPAPWPDDPMIIAGQDQQAGGTWLGARRQDGRDDGPLIVGVLNRRAGPESRGTTSGPRSRGTLCRELLGHSNVDSALSAFAHKKAQDYGGFNLLLADRNRAVVVHNAGTAQPVDQTDGAVWPGTKSFVVQELEQGLSVLTNLDVNDVRCPRLATAAVAFRDFNQGVRQAQDAAELLPGFSSILGNHTLAATGRTPRGNHDAAPDARSGSRSAQEPEHNPYAQICVHAGAYGTRSASVLAVSAPGKLAYFHASGPPCRADFTRVALPG